jgi:predicted amidophosphoribosyltransferase
VSEFEIKDPNRHWYEDQDGYDEEALCYVCLSEVVDQPGEACDVCQEELDDE